MTILEAVYRYLKDELSVSVYTQIPAAMPTRFVLIDKTGGGETNHIRRATVPIQSYAPTLAEAEALSEVVIEAMRDFVTVDMIISCKLNSDYNYTDPTTKQPRWQAVFDVKHY